MLTICVMLNILLLAARPATNSLYRYAEDTIVKSTVMVTKRHGGARRASIRCLPHAPFGSKPTFCRKTQMKVPRRWIAHRLRRSALEQESVLERSARRTVRLCRRTTIMLEAMISQHCEGGTAFGRPAGCPDFWQLSRCRQAPESTDESITPAIFRCPAEVARHGQCRRRRPHRLRFLAWRFHD